MDHLVGHSILPKIFAYLPKDDVIKCLRVNSQFHNIIEANSTIMQRDRLALEVQKHEEGYNVFLEVQSKSVLCARKDRRQIRITDCEIGFSIELEGFARIISRNRGNIDPHDRKKMLILLDNETRLDGLKEVLSLIVEKFRITVLKIYPTYQKIDTYTRIVTSGPFETEELRVIFDKLRNCSLDSFSSAHAPVQNELFALHRLVRERKMHIPDAGSVALNTDNTELSLKSLDTAKDIRIYCITIDFAPFGIMAMEWFKGNRRIRREMNVSAHLHPRGEYKANTKKRELYEAVIQWSQGLPLHSFKTDAAKGIVEITKSPQEILQIEIKRMGGEWSRMCIRTVSETSIDG